MAATDRLAAAVADALAQAGMGGASSMSRLPVGMSNAVFEVTLADGGRVVARASSVAKNRYAMERDVMDRARSAGVACPEVYAIETVDDLAVMLIEHIPGSRLGESRDGPQLVGQCGEILALIHGIDVTGFGSLTDAGEGEGDALERWFIDDFEHAFRTATDAGDNEIRAAVGRTWVAFDSARPLLRAARCALAHGDFSPTNILVDEGRVTAVLDWESAKAGPAAFDFGWWDWFEAAFDVPFTCDELVTAYAMNRSVDLDELKQMRRLVVLRILIGQIAWTASRGQKPELKIALRRLKEAGA